MRIKSKRRKRKERKEREEKAARELLTEMQDIPIKKKIN